MIAEYDITELSRRVSELSGALLGDGATEGELQQVLKTETGQLASRMGDAAGPRTLAKAMKKVDREMKRVFSLKPKTGNLDEQESESYADFTWLYASPTALVGINDEDNQIKASGQQAFEMLRAGQRSIPREGTYVEMGQRGKQKIMRLNRIRISTSAFNVVRRMISNQTGQLRAACYAVAKKYVPSKRIPQWIDAKIPAAVAAGKSRVEESAMDTPMASIAFAITSPGVVNNPRLNAKLQGAINATSESVAAKLEKIGKGAKYVMETGQVYFERTE